MSSRKSHVCYELGFATPIALSVLALEYVYNFFGCPLLAAADMLGKQIGWRGADQVEINEEARSISRIFSILAHSGTIADLPRPEVVRTERTPVSYL